MKKQFWQIAVLMLALALVLCACGTAPENENEETTLPAEIIIETTEPEIEPNPEWLSETAIAEAYACLFPLEGEKNVELAQEILLPLVEMGNAEAQYYWGYIYDWEVVDNNGDEEKESLYWYELAAEQGFPKAYLAAALNEYIAEERANELLEAAEQASLFEMTPEKLGADGCTYIGVYHYAVKKDFNAALNWYLKASELGSTVAMTEIGLMYYDGLGVKKDIDVSLDWLLKAANMGNVYAMNWYGYIFFENDYESEMVHKKYATALNEYREAAEAGDPIAMHNLGQMYEHGLGGLSINAETAFDWYLKAANMGDAYSMYRVGCQYQSGYGVPQDKAVAMDWYLKASELGNADAMEAIGIMYSQGWGVDRSQGKAKEWWNKASETRHSTANNNDTGYIDYFSDVSALRDVAIEFFQKAADAGNSTAMNNIGFYGYEKGNIYFDDGEARTWYKKAAVAGNATAMANLGFNYYRSQNYDSAMEWLIKAHANGADYVADYINNMLTNKQGVNAYFENYGELISAKP